MRRRSKLGYLCFKFISSYLDDSSVQIIIKLSTLRRPRIIFISEADTLRKLNGSEGISSYSRIMSAFQISEIFSITWSNLLYLCFPQEGVWISERLKMFPFYQWLHQDDNLNVLHYYYTLSPLDLHHQVRREYFVC